MWATLFFRPIQDLSEKFNILQSAMAASERIFKLLDEPVTIQSDPNAAPLIQPRGEIEFRNVWFSYRSVPEPADEDWVLRDVSFRVEPGQTFARSEEHTSELQSPYDLVCRLLLEKKKQARDATATRR